MANPPNAKTTTLATILEKKPEAPSRDKPAAVEVAADVAANPDVEKGDKVKYALEQKVSKSWNFLDYADKDKDGVITPGEWKASVGDMAKGKVPSMGLKFPASYGKVNSLSGIFDPNGTKHPWEISAPIEKAKLPEKMQELAYSNADIVALRAKTIKNYKDLRLDAKDTEHNIEYMDGTIAWLDINNDAQITREELLDRDASKIFVIDPTKGKDAAGPIPNLSPSEKIIAAQKAEADEFARQAWKLVAPFDANGDGYIQKEEEPKNVAGNESAIRFIEDIKKFRAAEPDAPVNRGNAVEVASKVLFTNEQMNDFLKETIDKLKPHIENKDITHEEAMASYNDAAAIVAKMASAGGATYAEMIKNTGGTSLVAKAPAAAVALSANAPVVKE